jgi:hypothetical protein
MSGLSQLSDPALKKRLDRAVPFLKASMEQQRASLAESRAICWPGRTLRLVDGTNIKQPGSKGTDWRVHAVFDLGGGRFSHLELTDHHGAESLERGAPEAGEIRIGDRNYARAKALHWLREESAGRARKQKKLDPRSLEAAGFIILATSLPAEGYPAEQVLAAYRLR